MLKAAATLYTPLNFYVSSMSVCALILLCQHCINQLGRNAMPLTVCIQIYIYVCISLYIITGVTETLVPHTRSSDMAADRRIKGVYVRE